MNGQAPRGTTGLKEPGSRPATIRNGKRSVAGTDKRTPHGARSTTLSRGAWYHAPEDLSRGNRLIWSGKADWHASPARTGQQPPRQQWRGRAGTAATRTLVAGERDGGAGDELCIRMKTRYIRFCVTPLTTRTQSRHAQHPGNRRGHTERGIAPGRGVQDKLTVEVDLTDIPNAVV